MANIVYKSSEIESFYSQNRLKWNQFYHSERVILEKAGLNPRSRVLDIGCGCGGLGLALQERFEVKDYVGIDINDEAIQKAITLNRDAKFISGDVLSFQATDQRFGLFDCVVSLSCIDWNVEFEPMLSHAMSFIKPGGVFVSSFRLSPNVQTYDTSAHQYINFSGQKEGEKAPYVVVNVDYLIKKLLSFQPTKITGYGYWGKPSSTASGKHESLCFAVFMIQKGSSAECVFDLDLPIDLHCNYG